MNLDLSDHRNNNVRQVFEPLDWQVEPFYDQHPIMLLEGSAGGGKTHLACEKMDAFMRKYPGSMGVMLRKTRESIVNSTVLFYERTVLGGTPYVTHLKNSHRFEYDNGSILAYGGMKDEAQREQIRSIGQAGGLDIAYMEEANKFTEHDFSEVLTRMRGRAAHWTQIVLATNPDSDTHWINQKLILPWLSGGSADVAVYRSHARDNKYNPEAYQARLDSLSGVTRKRLRDGIWCRAEGIIYDDWNPQKHVIRRADIEIKDEWPRNIVVDFGFTNPMVVQWWAHDRENDRLYRYREIYHTQRLVKDVGEMIKEYSKDEPIDVLICDHDAEGRATLEDMGLYTKAADKRVRLGIQKVQDRMRPREDGLPGIFFIEDALVHSPDETLQARYAPTCTEEEISAYIWEPPPVDKPWMQKEEPLKKNDHGCDCTRYEVMYIDRPTRGLFLW